jgi:cytochrome c
MKILKLSIVFGLLSGSALGKSEKVDPRQDTNKKLVPEVHKSQSHEATLEQAAHHATQLADELFVINPEKKRNQIEILVKRAVDFLLKNRPEVAFHAFEYDRQFTLGGSPLIVFDTKGTIYLHRYHSEIWGSRKEIKNRHGVNSWELMRDKAKNGGGWIQYESQGDWKESYVERVEKNGITYLIASGWYPMDKKSATINLVKTAVQFFNQHGRKRAFTEFSSKVGDFVKGDLYIFVLKPNGEVVAHGDNSALIGHNILNQPAESGGLVTKELIEAAQNGTHWTKYTWKNAPKVGYVELVSDESGDYVIGSGYYPETNRTVVADLVKRAAQYFNAWGREKAGPVFSYKVGEFVYGDTSIFMYDFKGNVIANGDNPEFVGQNLLDVRAPNGEYIVKKMIKVAESGGGWISYPWKNDQIVSYIERVRDKRGEYLIGAGFYPSSARERAIQLSNNAVGFLRERTLDVAFREFSHQDTRFIPGTGLELFVFNFFGDCLVYSDDLNKIWQNFKSYKDPKGEYVFKQFLQVAQSGGGWISFQSRGTTKMAYIQKAEKDGVQYIIGTAFYK